jgi:ribose/xylose/arabinose/galactoside ABC-type transport system permease subunit
MERIHVYPILNPQIITLVFMVVKRGLLLFVKKINCICQGFRLLGRRELNGNKRIYLFIYLPIILFVYVFKSFGV